jgi:hypothetical protein
MQISSTSKYIDDYTSVITLATLTVFFSVSVSWVVKNCNVMTTRRVTDWPLECLNDYNMSMISPMRENSLPGGFSPW